MKMKIKNVDSEEILEFISFNFDGEGGSLVLNHTTGKIESYKLQETKNMLLGENGKECKYVYSKE